MNTPWRAAPDIPGTRTWWWDIPDRPPAADHALLTSAERDRLTSMRSAERTAEFVSSRAVLRRLAGELLGVPAGEVVLGRRPCPGCQDPTHGPPAVLRPANMLWLSLSHTLKLGGVAVSDAPVGLDVERVRTVDADLLAAGVLTPVEREYVTALPPGPERDLAFLRCWTRKEAALKAVGVGITADLHRIDSHPEQDKTTTVTTPAGLAGPQTPTRWDVHDIETPDGWVAALAHPANTSPGTVAGPPGTA